MFYKFYKLSIFLILLYCRNIVKCENNKTISNCTINNINKIVGGEATPITSIPYQVAVLVSPSLCGGSLISLNIVLTAAHCVVDRSASRILIRAGSNYYDRNGVVARVSRVITHQYFNFQTMTHDIAVLKLARSLTTNELNKYGIHIIQMQTITPSDNSKVIVSGYGRLSPQGTLALTLQSVVVSIINLNQCNQKYGWKLTGTMICAGHPNGGRDSCQGDSGGPLAYQGKLLGIVSWGYGCASASYPGVYTSIPAMYSWIQSAVAGII